MKKEIELDSYAKLKERMGIIYDIRCFLEDEEEEGKKALAKLIEAYGEEDAENHLSVKAARYNISQCRKFQTEIDNILDNAL